MSSGGDRARRSSRGAGADDGSTSTGVLDGTPRASASEGGGEVFSTRFTWSHGGGQVHLCGSFTIWLETVPMAGERAPDGSSVFTVMCDLPPGYHRYKFIVDGQWNTTRIRLYKTGGRE